MKPRYLLSVLFSLTLLPAFAEVEEVTMKELQALGFLPQDKEMLRPEAQVDSKKLNPFAERSKKLVDSTKVENVESEESKIRNFFLSKDVTGTFTMNGKRTAIIGRLMLEEGKAVPSVIPGQTQLLRVTRVTEKFVELAWVEGVGLENTVPRKIQRPIDLSPKVMQMLASEEGTETDSKMYPVDPSGRLLPAKGSDLTPNPSAIVDSLPSSAADTVADQMEEEQAVINAEEGADQPLPRAHASNAQDVVPMNAIEPHLPVESSPNDAAPVSPVITPDGDALADPDASSAPPSAPAIQ